MAVQRVAVFYTGQEPREGGFACASKFSFSSTEILVLESLATSVPLSPQPGRNARCSFARHRQHRYIVQQSARVSHHVAKDCAHARGERGAVDYDHGARARLAREGSNGHRNRRETVMQPPRLRATTSSACSIRFLEGKG